MEKNFYDSPRIGLSYSTFLNTLTNEQLDAFDYIEVPFELLIFDNSVLKNISKKPIILHCASLSIAGYTPPSPAIVERIADFSKTTNSPWIGEHLSFILADRFDDKFYEPYTDEPYNIGFTVNPVMNQESVENVINNIANYQTFFKKPVIIENSPMYFSLPGSNMTQSQFISEICRQSGTKLLLDLTHLYITAKNFSLDPKSELKNLPLDRVLEVHVSGVVESNATHWDNHASHAPEIIFELLEILLQNAKPKAITFEYNWTSHFSWPLLEKELIRVKDMLSRC